MTVPTAWIRACLLSCWIVSVLVVPLARADLADEYRQARTHLEAIREQLAALKRERRQRSNPPLSRDGLEALRQLEMQLDTVYALEREGSLRLALKLSEYARENPDAPGGRTYLMRAYQVSKLYADGGACDLARPALEQCLAYPAELSTMRTSEGALLGDLVGSIERRCALRASSGAFEEVLNVDSKAAYVEPALRPLLTDSRAYTADEVERLLARRLPVDLEGGEHAARTRLGIDPGVRTLLRPPFLLVQGPGEFPAWALRMEKVLPGAFVSGEPLETEPLQSIYDNVVKPVHERMRHEMFDARVPGLLIPVYLAGGPLSSEGLLGWSAYCLEIHERRCGLSLGYYKAEDNSVAAWLSSGGGTLAHELVHALMAADFPGAPLWLDEGVASLQEVTRAGEPIDNYRHYYVRHALARYGELIPIAALIGLDAATLTGPEARNLHVALLRSFAHFLHDIGRLVAIYRQIRSLRAQSTAAQLEIVQAAFENRTLDDLQRQWQAWAQARQVSQDWAYLDPGAREDVYGLGASPPWRR